ncbi:hypothetical protein ABMA70_05030 [Halobacteriovorax sp. XZX-3]|uniref:hypothetical protein n=1 Tax=unclassified Halobacteriovorax TaxID=2639665 RepID=UPI0037192783
MESVYSFTNMILEDYKNNVSFKSIIYKPIKIKISIASIFISFILFVYFFIEVNGDLREMNKYGYLFLLSSFFSGFVSGRLISRHIKENYKIDTGWQPWDCYELFQYRSKLMKKILEENKVYKLEKIDLLIEDVIVQCEQTEPVKVLGLDGISAFIIIVFTSAFNRVLQMVNSIDEIIILSIGVSFIYVIYALLFKSAFGKESPLRFFFFKDNNQYNDILNLLKHQRMIIKERK